jgi:hypothetical protein
MMPSRGMGAIEPSKMPSPKKKARKDDTDFTQFAKGGEVWDKPRPKSLGKPKKMSSAKKAAAKASAKAAGRPYPNLIDNMKVSRK